MPNLSLALRWPLVVCLVVALSAGLHFADTISTIKSNPGTPAELEYNKAVSSFSTGDLHTAEVLFKKSLQLDPGLVASLIGLSEVSSQLKQWKISEGYLKRALELAPSLPQVHRAWGRFLYAQKRVNEAESALKKATALDSKFVGAWIDLGDLYVMGLNKPEDGVKAYRSLLAIDPNHGGAHFALGVALSRLGKASEAERELQAAAVLSPNNPMPPHALGRLYADQKEYGKALAAFGGALKVDPGFVQARLDSGDIYVTKGEYDKAISEYVAVSKSASPANAVGLVRIGMLEQKRGRQSEAEQAYLDAIKSNPKLAIAYNNLAWMMADRKIRLDDALKWAKQSTELAPNAPQFQDTLGWVHRARGELNRSVQVLERAAANPQAQAEVSYHLGVVYAEKGMNQKAMQSLRKALSKGEFPGAKDAKLRLEKLSR